MYLILDTQLLVQPLIVIRNICLVPYKCSTIRAFVSITDCVRFHSVKHWITPFTGAYCSKKKSLISHYLDILWFLVSKYMHCFHFLLISHIYLNTKNCQTICLFITQSWVCMKCMLNKVILEYLLVK